MCGLENTCFLEKCPFIWAHFNVDSEDKKKITFCYYPQFGNKGAVLINESALYSLVLRSDMPKAKKI